MDLDLDPLLSEPLREEMLRRGRALGVPLWQLELLGQEASIAIGFINACRRGEGRAYLDRLDVDRLEAMYQTRAQARRAPLWRRPRISGGQSELLPLR